MAYSTDFRKRAVEFMNEGHTGKELREAFKVWPSVVKLLETLEAVLAVFIDARNKSGDAKHKYRLSRTTGEFPFSPLDFL
jgi:hypothetical protein